MEEEEEGGIPSLLMTTDKEPSDEVVSGFDSLEK